MNKTNKTYGDINIKKLDKSQLEITGHVPSESWEKFRTQALKNVNESITVDGFRKGMIPENVLIAKVGEMAVLEEMAELALSPAYMDIIIDNKIDAIGRPDIHLTKLAKGNNLEFKIVTAVIPEVTLPDYKKIAQEIVTKQNSEDVKLTPEEIENTITRIKRSANTQQTKADSEIVPSDGTKNNSENKFASAENNKEVDSKDLPELTDAFVQKLGAFSDVSDFKAKLTQMLLDQKREQAEEKKRIALADAISDGAKVDLPEILVESETARIEAQFGADIERMGVKLEDYLKHAKKSIDDLRVEWRPHAEKKAKLQLVLNEIANKEHIKPTADEVEHEVKHILEHYKDADTERATTYAETVLTNEKVFEFLEGGK